MYAREQDPELLRSLYFHLSQHSDAGVEAYRESLEQKDSTSAIKQMKLAATYMAQGKDASAMGKIIEEQARLLEIQKEIEQGVGPGYVGLSLSDTLLKCFRCGQGKRAVKIIKEFKIGEKPYYFIKIKGLAQGRDWEELEKFAAEKSKPPVGFEAFAAACITENNTNEAMKYIPKVADLGRKCELFVSVG